MNANIQLVRRVPDIRYARLDGWFVDVPANRVQRAGTEVRLTPKAMAVLRELLQRPGQVVRRDDLLGIVWRDGFPTDDVLTHAITELRRALDDDPRAPRLIETIPRVGYRLVATVEILAEPPLVVRATTIVAPAATASAPVSDAAQAPAPPQPPPRARPVAIALAILAALVGVVLAALALTRTPPEPASPPAAATVTPPAAPSRPQVRAITTDLTREQFPSVAPDGSSVAYVVSSMTGSQIVVRGLDAAATPRALTELKEGIWDNFPRWSPDGMQIAFLHMNEQDCAIHVMPALGGPSRRVAPCRSRVLDYMEWTADSGGLYISSWRKLPSGGMTMSYIHRLDLATGKLHPMPYTPSTTEADIQPRISPDGRVLAFRRGGAPYSDIYVVPVEGGEPRRLTRLQSMMRGYAWYPDSRTMVVSSDHEGEQALYRVDVASGAVVALGVTDTKFPDIARNAPVAVFQKESQLTQLTEIALGGPDKGKGHALAPSTRSDMYPSYSPDARRIAFVSSGSGAPQVWLYDFAADNAWPLTRHANLQVATPRWSPDGTRVLHVVRGVGHSTLFAAEVESGRSVALSGDDENVRFGSYSHDGRWIYFSSDRGGQWQAWRMPAAGGAATLVSEHGAIDPQDPLGDGNLYYTRETFRGLLRLDLATREEVVVSPYVGYWNLNAWAMTPKGLYLLDSGEETVDGGLFRMDPVAMNVDARRPVPRELVSPITQMLSTMDMSLTPAADRMVVVETTRDETDLMALTLDP